MLSGEDHDNVLTDCNAMNLLEGFTDPIQIRGNTERQVEDSLKSCLKEVLKRRLSQKSTNSNTDDNTQSRSDLPQKKTSIGSTPKDKQQNKRKKSKKQQSGNNSPKTKADKKQDQAPDVDKIKETNVLFFNGTHLKFILRDQTLEKLFLSLCNLSSLCMGTSVTPLQRKFVVKAIRSFALQGKLGNVISIISQ